MFGKREYDYEDSFTNLSSIHDVRRRKLWTWSAHFFVWTIAAAVTLVPGMTGFLLFLFFIINFSFFSNSELISIFSIIIQLCFGLLLSSIEFECASVSLLLHFCFTFPFSDS
jgi:hypothetical protein